MWDCVTLLDDATAAEVERARRARRRSRSRTRTTTRRWSSGRTASTARSTCTPPTPSGSCGGPGDRPLGRRDARARPRPDADPRRRPLPRRHDAAPPEGDRRAADRRHHPGHPRPHARRLHVELPQPRPAARAPRSTRSPRRSSRSSSRRSTAPGGTAIVARRQGRSSAARPSATARAARRAMSPRAASNVMPARAQALDQRVAHRDRGRDLAGGRRQLVAGEAERRLGEHLGGLAVARVAARRPR